MGSTDTEITTKELAVRLGISVRQIQRLVTRGKLHPSKKLPGRTSTYLFNEADYPALEATQPTPVG
jgi:excisionase family DNA binding protein